MTTVSNNFQHDDVPIMPHDTLKVLDPALLKPLLPTPRSRRESTTPLQHFICDIGFTQTSADGNCRRSRSARYNHEKSVVLRTPRMAMTPQNLSTNGTNNMQRSMSTALSSILNDSDKNRLTALRRTRQKSQQKDHLVNYKPTAFFEAIGCEKRAKHYVAVKTLYQSYVTWSSLDSSRPNLGYQKFTKWLRMHCFIVKYRGINHLQNHHLANSEPIVEGQKRILNNSQRRKTISVPVYPIDSSLGVKDARTFTDIEIMALAKLYNCNVDDLKNAIMNECYYEIWYQGQIHPTLTKLITNAYARLKELTIRQSAGKTDEILQRYRKRYFGLKDNFETYLRSRNLAIKQRHQYAFEIYSLHNILK